MPLSSPPESSTADADTSTSSESSAPVRKGPTIQELKSLARNALTDPSTLAESSAPVKKDSTVKSLKSLSRHPETDTATSSDSSGPIRIESTVQYLKSLSRNAKADTSVSSESSGPTGKEPTEEFYEGLSSKADTKASTSTESSRSAKKESSGEYLESLSRSILNVCLNLKDPNHPLIHKHQSPDFRNKHDAPPKASNRDDHQENLQKHLAEQKNFHVEIHNTSSEVDDSRGRGTVYLWYEITGLANGLEREAVAVLSWERKQGTWVLMKHIGMRGPAGFC